MSTHRDAVDDSIEDDARTADTSGPSRGRWLKPAVFGVLVVAAVAVALTVDIPDAASVRDRVDAAGVWGVLLFVLVYAALSLTPFPASALTIAAGLLFGFVSGVLVVVVSATLGAWIGFGIARWLGRESVSRRISGRGAALDRMLTSRGLPAVIVVRLIPVFPFALVNYAAGLSGVRQRHYVIGTVVGILPATAGYTALGAYGTSPLSWPFLAAVAAVVVVTVVSSLVARRMRRSDPGIDD
ncbi:TVP38/TMEM64 family protein [Williamsia sp. SKLECPSW1]